MRGSRSEPAGPGLPHLINRGKRKKSRKERERKRERERERESEREGGKETQSS